MEKPARIIVARAGIQIIGHRGGGIDDGRNLNSKPIIHDQAIMRRKARVGGKVGRGQRDESNEQNDEDDQNKDAQVRLEVATMSLVLLIQEQ